MMLQMSSLTVACRSPLVSQSLRPSQLAFGKAAVPKSLANRPAFTSSDRMTFQVTAGKMKTRKSAAKRYKVTASGKVLHRRPGKAHLNGPKTSERKSRLSIEATVGTSQLSLVRACLPYARI
mmetsp:Transcript_5498/g.12151  ORF Transcript_5498/g.12151 Transcript_5498/m.12151 type:complete len:122 (-) Transcript_5498:6894-7259(-)